jgi:hypothetical protein
MQLGADVAELFAREPRAEAWASGMEAGALADALADVRMIVPNLKASHVECRSRICLLSWASLGQALDEKVHHAVIAVRVAPSLKRTTVDDETAGIYLIYRPRGGFAVDEGGLADRFDASDPARFREKHREVSRSFFEAVRTGKARLPPTLADVRLPE